MENSEKNIQFNYGYSDAANYKQWGKVIFANSIHINVLEPFELIIRKELFDEEFFYPYQLNIPSIHFDKWNRQLDHDWYHFVDLEFTEEPVTDNRSFDAFLLEIKKFAKKPSI